MESKFEKLNSTSDSSERFLEEKHTPFHGLSSSFYLDLFIHPAFFKRGIIIVSPIDGHEKISKEDSFVINNREFSFSSPELNCMPDGRALKNTTNLLSELITFSSTKTKESKIHTENEHTNALFNKKRREEVFLPVIFNTETSSTGLYVYPWTSKVQKNYDFKGITQFVTAGCMFGASMRAITQDGDNLELINHKINLRPNQYIQTIAYDKSIGNPFELILFEEFKKTCLLINALSKTEDQKKLLFHLPSYDYILFGVGLFIRKQMTFKALDSFTKAVYIKELEYQETICALCAEHNISVEFISPFTNLFDSVDHAEGAKAIIERLGINTCDQSETPYCTEKNIVERCLFLLTNNTFQSEQQKIWCDFLSLSTNEEYQDIESLFKIGNAIIVAMASKNQNHHEVCSLLPLSEKQIQIGYDDYRKKYTKNNSTQKIVYPSVLNITIFEPVVTYSPTTNGLLFYFSSGLNTLCSLIKDKKIHEYASRNVSLFAREQIQKIKNDYNQSTESTPIEFDSILLNDKNESFQLK